MAVKCRHKTLKLIENNFPEYMKMKCEDCGVISKYSGLQVTSIKETFKEQRDVIETTVTYIGGKPDGKLQS
jgi:hypothetical protein